MFIVFDGNPTIINGYAMGASLVALKALEKLYKDGERWNDLLETYEAQLPLLEEDDDRLVKSAMLARARRLKGEKDLKGAERAYKELRRAWPKSPEARASAVALGQVRLKLGKARGALSAFDAYLSKGGALAEEARWGKVRALDALNRTAARDAAIDELFAKHPRTVYRRKAKALQE